MESSESSALEGIDLEYELRRIGVDLMQLGGLATAADITPRQVIQWLRRQPTGLGHSAFMARLRATAFELPPDAEELPRDASFVDPELEERRALYAELARYT